MPVNNWIPVARDFTQYLDVQAQRRKKRIQQGIMQQLPQYISNELGNVKTKEDIYRKLPELSAQMFAIDPEIGAHATQIANQYGQMKLQQINEVENEETAKRGLDVLKNTFGSVNVMHKGKVTPFANVLDEITPSMRSEDALKLGETILKAGQIKREAISEFTKGKPTLTVYQMLNGEPVEKPKQYYINAKTRTLDDMSTKDIETLPMGIEETRDLAKFELDQFNRKQALSDRMSYLAASKEYQKDMSTLERKGANVLMKDASTQFVMFGKREMERPDPNNPNKKVKVLEDRFFDVNSGADITDKVDRSKVYAADYNVPGWDDYRKEANDAASQVIGYLREAKMFDKDDRLQAAFGGELVKTFKMDRSKLSTFGYATDILDALNRTSPSMYHGQNRGADALVIEIAAELGWVDPTTGQLIDESKRTDYYKLWSAWKQFRQANQLRNQKSPVQQSSQSTQQNSNYDPNSPSTW